MSACSSPRNLVPRINNDNNELGFSIHIFAENNGKEILRNINKKEDQFS